MHKLTKVALLAAAIAIAPLAAHAKSSYGSTFNTRYGTANTVLDDCGTCHGSSGTSSFNAYGNALISANIGSNVTNALATVEPLDSDRDGFTNLVEIRALTLPGDARDFPAPTASPCPDADGDGYVVCDGTCAVPTGKQCGDCNDANRAVNPGVTEVCTNGVDDNCDGAADLEESVCTPTLSDWAVKLSASGRAVVGRAIRIKAVVTTVVPGPASLKVFGAQNGLNIPLADVTAAALTAGTYAFTYTPTAAGEIVWTAQLTDQTAGDADTKTAATAVK